MHRKIIYLTPILAIAALTYAERQVVTYIRPLSPNTNAARWISGWHTELYKPTPNNYMSITVTPEVTRSFRSNRIVQCMFGDHALACTNGINISGSQVQNRDQFDWLADYFGLPPDFKSSIYFSPNTSNTIAHLSWYASCNGWVPGLYIAAELPVVYSRWDFDMCEHVTQEGVLGYAPGYFTSNGSTRTDLLDGFISYISGLATPRINGTQFNPLSRAKISCRPLRQFNFAELTCVLGYLPISTDYGHVGINVRAAIPGGTKPTGEFLFEPIIGNGHHFELGIGLNLGFTPWKSNDNAQQFSAYFDLNLTHLFNSQQCRSFDLACKRNSRYVLAAKLGTPIQGGLTGQVDGSQITPTAQFQQEVTSIANLTTTQANVHIGIQADLALMIVYTQEQRYHWAFGYGFTGDSGEKISLCGKTPLDCDTWAIKGDAHVFGFNQNNNAPVALSATQSRATVESGNNFRRRGPLNAAEVLLAQENQKVDNPALAFSNGTVLTAQPGGATQINTSIQPVILSSSNLDVVSAQTRIISHKVFGSITFTWPGDHEPKGIVSLGAQAVLGQRGEPAQPINESYTINCATSYWSVWIKAGVSFY